METSVVLFDPRPSPLRLGTVMVGHQTAKLEAAGVVLLPIEGVPSHVHAMHPAQQYCYRSFGENAVSLQSDTPKRAIGLMLDANRELPNLHWLIGVAATGPESRGVFTLLSDAGVTGKLIGGSIHGDKSILEPGELPLPGDSVVLGGHASLVLSQDGLAGFSIHASAHDVCILWAAVSQCAVPRPLGALLR